MRMKIAEYDNGNVHVTRFDDGTVIRCSVDDEFDFAFPENMDIKLTNCCTGTNCAWCHEGSGPNGQHGDIMTAEWVDSLHSFTECALGGGNVLEHPDLIPFLYKLKKHQVFANITVNQIHFMQNLALLRELSEKQLIRGVGVSFHHYDNEFLTTVEQFPNAVLHVIAGVLSDVDLCRIMTHHDLKILILGYKRLRRGEVYYQKDIDELLVNHGLSQTIDWRTSMIERMLPLMLEAFKVVSFDCLAIEQLHIQKHLPTQVWNTFYQGDDGTMTFYIDMVNKQFAASSTAPLEQRMDIGSLTVDQMFQTIRNNKSNSGKQLEETNV